MKQTAVEWLESEFIKLEKTTGVYGIMYELLARAKEIEKEQIMDAFIGGDVSLFNETPEQYYNETFKQDR